MDTPVSHALLFIRELAALAERLAMRNIVVRCLYCDWSAFGSWTIEASSGLDEAKRSTALNRHDWGEAGPEVYRVVWDGRDRQLSMASTPTTVSVMPNQWRHRDPLAFESTETALAYAEEWLCDNVGKGNAA